MIFMFYGEAGIHRKEFPVQPLTHDPRIKAAVIVDPLALIIHR
jgi:hypothetical protein